MADLKTHRLRQRLPGQHPDGESGEGAAAAGTGQTGPRDDRAAPGGPGGWRASWRAIGRAITPAALWRGHRLFIIVVVVSLLPRILAALSFRPALLTADSFLYMQNAVNGKLGTIRPSGYSFFLSIFQGLPHTLLVVTTIQHLMGVAIAVIVYALLRHWGLPGWGATLAALPTLFDVREIALESYILPDTLFCLVIIIAVAMLMTRRTPLTWQCVVAGLMLAYASVLRGNGIPLVVVVAAFLLVRKVGWKAFVAASVAFVVPLLGYVLAFHSEYGKFNVTSSDGLFLWSRTTSFANCAIIKPPADLRPLCPSAEKSIHVPPAQSWSISHLLNAPTPSDYLWASDVWWRHDAKPGINSYNSKLGERFAIDAIKAQPLGYLRVVGRDVLLTFVGTDRPQGSAYMTFTPQPRIAHLPSYYQRDIKAYAGTTANTHAVYPEAFFLFLYQQPVIFPGLVFLAIVLAGLVGVLKRWRRWGGIQGLPWALAAVSILSPALLTQSLYRYVIVAIPLACLAAALNFAQIPGRRAKPVPAAAGFADTGPSPAPPSFGPPPFGPPPVDPPTGGVPPVGAPSLAPPSPAIPASPASPAASRPPTTRGPFTPFTPRSDEPQQHREPLPPHEPAQRNESTQPLDLAQHHESAHPHETSWPHETHQEHGSPQPDESSQPHEPVWPWESLEPRQPVWPEESAERHEPRSQELAQPQEPAQHHGTAWPQEPAQHQEQAQHHGSLQPHKSVWEAESVWPDPSQAPASPATDTPSPAAPATPTGDVPPAADDDG